MGCVQRSQSHGNTVNQSHQRRTFSCYPDYEAQCQDPMINASNATGFIYENTCYMPLRTELLSVVHVAAWLCIIESISLVSY